MPRLYEQVFTKRMQKTKLPLRYRQRALNRSQRAEVKKLILNQQERKAHETDIASGTDISNTIAFYDLFDPAQGDGEGQRIGDEVSLNALSFRYLVGAGGGAVASTHYYGRVIIFKWHPDTADDSPSDALDILQESAVTALRPADDAQRRKATFLYDRVHVIHGSTTGAGTPAIHVSKRIKLRGKAYFKEGVATGKNKLYIALLSNTGTANAIEIDANLRVEYTDN